MNTRATGVAMHAKALAVITLAILVAACETTSPRPAAPAAPPPPVAAPKPPPPPPPEPVKPVPPPKTPAELALDVGLAAYDAGDYNAAVKSLLGAQEIWNGPDAIKVKAHKTLALSYCVTNRRTLCRAQFVDALKIDPAFDLEPAEKTHPIWGPEYNNAKKALAAPAPAKPAPKKPAAPPPASAAPAK